MNSVEAATASLTAHGTAAVSDALDILGVHGTLWGPRRMSGTGAVAGPVFTVAFEPVKSGEQGPAADFLDEVPPGAVVVLANAGRRCTVWGDILAEVAQARGVAATVIDGYCRDLDAIRRLGYPVWANGAFMRSGKSRVRLAATQRPVTLGRDDEALTVRPGDVVCADGSGVTVTPRHLVTEIADHVERIAAMEKRVLREVAAGSRLADARAKHGYNRASRVAGVDT